MGPCKLRAEKTCATEAQLKRGVFQDFSAKGQSQRKPFFEHCCQTSGSLEASALKQGSAHAGSHSSQNHVQKASENLVWRQHCKANVLVGCQLSGFWASALRRGPKHCQLQKYKRKPGAPLSSNWVCTSSPCKVTAGRLPAACQLPGWRSVSFQRSHQNTFSQKLLAPPKRVVPAL